MPRMTIELSEEDIKVAVEAWLRDRTNYDDWEVIIGAARRTAGDMCGSYDVWYATAQGSRQT